MPYREAIFLALWANLSLDYLLTGRGTLRFRPAWERSDYELLRTVLANAKGEGRPPSLTPELSLKIAKAYERADQILAQLAEKELAPVSSDEVQRAALVAIDLFKDG